jgi:hypothetical protein
LFCFSYLPCSLSLSEGALTAQLSSYWCAVRSRISFFTREETLAQFNKMWRL